MTPLHAAAFWGCTKVIELLIKHGINIDAVNKKSKTALAIALECNHTDVARELVKRYAFVGGHKEAIRNLPGELLQNRRKELIEILDNSGLNLPTVLRNLIIQFVTEQ